VNEKSQREEINHESEIPSSTERDDNAWKADPEATQVCAKLTQILSQISKGSDFNGKGCKSRLEMTMESPKFTPNRSIYDNVNPQFRKENIPLWTV
jgi:hypothetical protein